MSGKKIDSLVHAEILSSIVRSGHAPSAGEISRRLRRSSREVKESLLRLAENHGLALQPGSTEVWVAHPFSLSPTATWVEGSRRGWWAPCLWCAFGIAALL